MNLLNKLINFFGPHCWYHKKAKVGQNMSSSCYGISDNPGKEDIVSLRRVANQLPVPNWDAPPSKFREP
jgi:hypothetical protein